LNDKSFIQRHPLVSYFALAYGITWGGIILFLASKGFQLSAIQLSEFPLVALLMLLGPSTSGLVLTAVLDGRAGFRDLGTRLTRWRVGWTWVVVALLTIPALVVVILAVLSAIVSPAFAPGFQPVGVVFGLLAGGLEEIGWTGFATPRLLKRHSLLKAGFILGLLWAFWHILADLTFNFNSMGPVWPLWLITYWILPLIAYRMLMTWVYAHTQSLLVAQLMHASYTGWLYVLSPAAAFSQNLLWQTAFAASLWAIVAVVAIVNRRQQRRAARAGETDMSRFRAVRI
jgi:membrane protease YdiL (CAAX protease family)